MRARAFLAQPASQVIYGVNIFGSMSIRWMSQKLFDLAKSSTDDPGEDGPFYGLGPQLATFSLDRDHH